MAVPLGVRDTFTEDGLWWIEGRESERVGGTITFDPVNGPVLELLGMLRDFAETMKTFGTNDNERPTIYGVTARGQSVSLLRALNTRSQINMPGIAVETWKADLLVIGFHLSDDERQAIFSKSYVRFEGIEKWLGHNPFEVAHHLSERSITVKANKPLEVHFADHEDFKVTSVGSLYANNTPDTRYTIDVYSQLGVTPQAPQSLRWHFAKATKLQELASLCSGHYLPMISLELRGPPEPSSDADTHPSAVHVYVRTKHSEGSSRLGRDSPVLTGPELIAFNKGAVQKWFDQYEVLSPAIQLFFTITGQREMFTNIRFLLAIQALEVFHRRTKPEYIMPEAEFDALRSALVAAIPATAGERMKERLKRSYEYLNEPNLGQRLKSIVADLSEAFGFAPPAFDKRYLRKLVDTRNYYTHFSRELEEKKLNGPGMYWASQRIVLLLTLLFLIRLEVKAIDLLKLLNRQRAFSKLWAAADAGVV